MKLSSLLTAVSSRAIGGSLAVGIAFCTSAPALAETVKDSQIKSTPIGIGNKDYRNKQNEPSLIGHWKAVINERGEDTELYVTFGSDGTVKTLFQPSG